MSSVPLLLIGAAAFRDRLGTSLRARGHAVTAIPTPEAAVAHLGMEPDAVVLLELGAPGDPGLAALRTLQAIALAPPVVVVAERPDVATAVEAMRLGAADFLPATAPLPRLERALARVAQGGPRRPEGRPSRRPPRNGQGEDLQVFFAHSEAMRKVQALIEQAAATDATVLIEGESGAGKSLVAYALHAASARRDRPLVKVNCATLPGELLESELFGHERGAFTGAHRRKPGKFELAHQGTLFLDEVGELPPPLQAKLLQVLQDGEFARVGGERDVRVDVRVLAASNRDLERAVADGLFRQDLYYRLNVVRIQVPPLRERREEIPILAEHFLRVYAGRYNRPARALAPETLACFLAYDWPGNVRELENLVKRIVVLDDEAGVRATLRNGMTISPAPSVPVPVPASEPAGNPVPDPVSSLSSLPVPDQIPLPPTLDLKSAVRQATREVERRLIREALERSHWNRVEAARLLHISYKALLYKMRELEINDSERHGPHNG